MSNGYFDAALKAEGMTGYLADLARSIFQQESSGGRNTQTSNAGAVGGMQIIPKTFNSMADLGWDINNPEHNARAGMRYLKMLGKQSGGDPALTAAGYYGGPGGMEKARQGIAVYDPRNPKAPNTLQYGQEVVARMSGGKGKGSPVVSVAPPVVGSAPVVQGVQVPAEMPAVPEPPIAVATMPEWTDFQQAMVPKEVRPADLNFGQTVAAAVNAPQFSLPRFENRAVNFKGFQPRRLKA